MNPTEPAGPPAPLSLRDWLLVACWTGVVAGLAELGVFVAKVHLVQSGLFRQSPHALWMIPVADLLIFAAIGLGLGLLVRPIPRFGRWLASLALGASALFAVLLAVPGLRAWSCALLAVGLASWIVPVIVGRPERFRRLVLWTTPALALVLVGLAGTVFGGRWWSDRAAAPTGRAPEGAPNVLLVVLDTVRADATSLGGSARDTTPRLAALARRGARFDRAIATSPWTLPSHASMFTGRWAGELDVGPDRALDGRFPTLAGHLGRQGYDTAGFVANTTFATAEYGLARGFARYDDHAFSILDLLRSASIGWWTAQRASGVLDRVCVALGREAAHPLEFKTFRKDADRINRDALAWIARPRDRPFFVFLNYFDTHDPYLLPEGVPRTFGHTPQTLAERQVLRGWIDETPRDRPPAEFALARDAYDDCLAYLDDRVGRLVDELERLGLRDDTILIVTADHGEHFGEHRRDGLPLVGHRLSVHQAEVHVPLVVVAPGRVPEGLVVPAAVSLRDLPATVLDLIGLRGGSPFPGRSIVAPLVGSDQPALDGVAFAEFNPRTDLAVALRYQAEAKGLMRAVVTEDASLVRDVGGHDALFDLKADPGEAVDRSGLEDARPLLDRLRALLDGFLRLAPVPPRSP